MLWGGSRSTKPCVFPCKVAAAGDERYLVCAAGAAGVVLCTNGSSYVFCKNACSCVRSCMRFFTLWLHDRIGMAAWMLHGLCCGEEAGARNLVFFRVKWLQPAMKDTSSVRRVRLGSFCARMVPPMCFARMLVHVCVVLFGSSLSGCMIALEWPHEGCMGNVVGRKPEHKTLCVFRVKWLQPAMKGTSSVRRVRLGSFCARMVPPMCFARMLVHVCVVLCGSSLSGCMIALEWLHECCMGYVVGRKPEHETLCFSV